MDSTMEKILVPTDFSNAAEMAFNFAKQIAKKNKASITLLHAMDVPVALEPTLMDPSIVQEIGEESMQSTEQLMRDLKEKNCAECDLDYFIGSGPVLEVINRYRSLNHIDSIVMGTHGASGFKEIFIGSNAEKVIRRAKVPVYTIPNKLLLDDIKSLLIPIDINDISDGFLHGIKELINLFEATPHFLYIDTPTSHINEDEFYTELDEILQHRNFEDYQIHTERDFTAESGIFHAAKILGSDMICLATHGKVGLSHLIEGSLAEDIANHSRIPVWTYNLKMEEHFEEMNNLAFAL